MKISYNWLKSLIPTSLPADEISRLLTDAGLEVEAVTTFETIKGGLEGVVIGEVIECGKHPGADRLKITRVDIGKGEPLSIVCGAPNVEAGQKVAVATVGSRLYPSEGEPIDIKKSKIRGEISEGMICAEDEIGLGKSHEGIMVLDQKVATGAPASEYFKVENDTVLEIGLTPNRSDAASHLGVAREIASIINTSTGDAAISVNLPGMHALPPAKGKESLKVYIAEKSICARYSGIIIKNIAVSDSPQWLQNRLRSIGIRPINNIVDITNFVLHELGQPLHAFDLSKIGGKEINVRSGNEGEKFVTLDGVERTLRSGDPVIADNEKCMCIAGVFGGINSGVTKETKDIFIESAYFEPAAIRSASKHHALKTDASFRFERGTDPDMTVNALTRAANLVLEIAGGEIAGPVTDVYPEKLAPYRVAFSYSNCTELIGKEIDRSQIKTIILSLGITIESEGSDGLLLLVPRYKTDVTREVDVIEEVLRIYGYNNVPVSKSISYTSYHDAANTESKLEEKAATVLEGFGFNEMMSLSLTSASYYPEESPLVKVINPLSSDLNVLRNNMLFSGLEAISHNINRKNNDLKFYEFGRTYQLHEKNYLEEKNLVLFVTGSLFEENPYQLKQLADLSFLKTAIIALLKKCGVHGYKIDEHNHADFEFAIELLLNNKKFIEAGSVAPVLLKKFDIPQPVFYAKINWKTFVAQVEKAEVIFEEISKYPSVRRDLALLLDKSVKYRQVEELAFSTERKLLKEVNLFDIYEGEKLGNKRSYAVSFTLLNTEGTLTDKQIDSVMQKLITGYKEKLGAELR